MIMMSSEINFNQYMKRKMDNDIDIDNDNVYKLFFAAFIYETARYKKMTNFEKQAYLYSNV